MTEAPSAGTRAERVRLEHGRAAVEVAPGVGGRLAALVVDGWDLVRRDGWTDNEWGVFVMAPWVGRLRDARIAWRGRSWSVPATEPPHALHGLAASVPWTVKEAGARSVRFERGLVDAWAPGGRLVHRVTLEADRVVLDLELHADAGPVPGILGWHPWFRRSVARAGDGAEAGPVEIEIRAGTRVETDAAGLPTGALVEPRADPVDDVLLRVTGDPVVRWPGGPRLALRSPAAAWIAYTAHPDGVCVEPCTGLPDGLNGGLLGEPPVATPDVPLTARLDIAWD